ncbi:Translation initiation factor IF-2, partial [Sesbania bispinosa]
KNKSGSENVNYKKLSFTPTTRERRTKDPKVEASEKNTPKKRNAIETMTSKEATKKGKKRNDSESDTKIKAFGKKKPKIIRLVSLKLTYIHCQENGHSFWILPPDFVFDVYKGSDVETILKTYAND